MLKHHSDVAAEVVRVKTHQAAKERQQGVF